MPITRRTFIKGLFTSALIASNLRHSLAADPKYRAAIIGASGQGNYGHELDLVFKGRPNVEVVGLADFQPEGLKKVAEIVQPTKTFSDYREMLEETRPDLVVIAPRWSRDHHPMALAALDVKAHILLEKPFAESVLQADEILAKAARLNRKVAVAHQMRLGPSIQHLKRELDKGLIGRILKITAHGKQDNRAGGEDMIVLGTHLFELMTFFTGDPLWCSARVLERGKEISHTDRKRGTEEIGEIYGDDIEAQFAFNHGITATFSSKKAYRETAGPWGMEIVGEKGRVHILAEVFPTCFIARDGKWSSAGKTTKWEPLPGDPALAVPANHRSFTHSNQRVVDDWLAAIASNREPGCNGRNAAMALEMCHAVFMAGFKKTRIEFPIPRT